MPGPHVRLHSHVIALVLGLCCVAGAQTVRVRTTQGIGLEGTVLDVGPEGVTLKLKGSGTSRLIPWTRVRKVDGKDPRLAAFRQRQTTLRQADRAHRKQQHDEAIKLLEPLVRGRTARIVDRGPPLLLDCYLQAGRRADAFGVYYTLLKAWGPKREGAGAVEGFPSTTLDPESLLIPDVPLPRPEDAHVAKVVAGWRPDGIASEPARRVAKVFQLVGKGILGDASGALRDLAKLDTPRSGVGADLVRVARAELLCVAGRPDGARKALGASAAGVAKAVQPMWLYWAGRCEMARPPGRPMEALLYVLRVPAEHGAYRVVSGHSLLLAARCFAQVKDTTSARTCYEQILAHYGVSAVTGVARERLRKLAPHGS